MSRILTAGTLFCASVCAAVPFDFTADPDGFSVDTMETGGSLYQLLSVPGFTGSSGLLPPGTPEMPCRTETFLLPPGMQVDSVLVTSMEWEPLSGSYNLPLCRFSDSEDRGFTQADSGLYSSVFPSEQSGVLRQGSAMGFNAVTLYGYPVRWTASEGSLEVLTSATVELVLSPAEGETLTPARESLWSAQMRLRGIQSLVSNPDLMNLYAGTEQVSFENRSASLAVTEFPSLQGDCVDMVIITAGNLAEAFQEVADYRTRHGIVTIVRTVEWIDMYYSGCDTPERIRAFLADAHENWGSQAVLLGGDAQVVPVRETGGWEYIPVPYPAYQLPSDDYYGDLDGNWAYDGSVWRVQQGMGYLDICTGRWPVNSPHDVETMFQKLMLYETPVTMPENFARKILLIGSNNPAGSGAYDMSLLAGMLTNSPASQYLDSPAELYFPHELPAGNLNRVNALEEFSNGYNLIIHADHSETHKLGMAGNGTLGQFLWDSDFATMNNTGEPSILWTLGCYPGHFDGAFCFSEAGLITSGDTGLIASISNARGGTHGQKTTAYLFCDALFNTGYIADQFHRRSLHWPLTHLGEAYRASKNLSGFSFMYLNLLGPPLLNVWRGDPEQLEVFTPLMFVREGAVSNITATVTTGGEPVEGASVCLWKKNELFAIEYSDTDGHVTFSGVSAADGSTGEQIHLTAVKRREQVGSSETAIASFMPGTFSIDILQSVPPVLSLAGFIQDPQGDGTANPGETVDVFITTANTGGTTSQNATAQLILTGGGQHISSIPCDLISVPDIEPDHTGTSTEAFIVEIAPNAPPGATVQFQVQFSCNGVQRQCPLFLTIESSSYSLPIVSSHAEVPPGSSSVVTLDDLVLANNGIGEDQWLSITALNLNPPEPFTVNTIVSEGVPRNSTLSIPGSIVLTVTPEKPDSPWLNKDFDGCSFDVAVTAQSGTSVARHVDAELVAQLQSYEISSPELLVVTESGEDFISFTWDHDGFPEASGYFVYLNGNRVYPQPLPVKQVALHQLEPGVEYEVGITAVDATGRESSPESVTASTGYPQVPGWPLLLNGSPGAGPLTADLDDDGQEEIAVLSSFGAVFIIERNGAFQTLHPPAGYDYDRFLGLAAGDVTGDGRTDLVAACQRKMEVEGAEQVSILLFTRTGMLWHSFEIAASQTNEELATTLIGGTPLLFQADSTAELEIALRTRGNNGGSPHLYVWKHSRSDNSWECFSDDFPYLLNGGFFDTPSAADFDGDGFEELITTNYASGEPGTELLVTDFEADGTVNFTGHPLYELNTGGYLARVFGTVALAEQNGTFFIAGVAKPESYCSPLKKIFACAISKTDSVCVTPLWQTDWMQGKDFFGNMPGPSIANISGNENLEVIYSLNGGIYHSEGVIQGYDLITGEMVFQSEPIPFCPVYGGGGEDIRSQTVAGLTSAPGSSVNAFFTGFSTACTGADPRTSPAAIPGFPVFFRDAVWAAPAVCDLNGDNRPELLYIDDSGCASLFHMNQFTITGNTWTMYQANPRRTGFVSLPRKAEELDISIEVTAAARISSDCGDTAITARLTVTGFSEPEGNRTCIATAAEIEAVHRLANQQVTVAAYMNEALVYSMEIPLCNGVHTVSIPEPPASSGRGTIRLVADPENRYPESDETNNTAEAFAPLNGEYAIVPTPASVLTIDLNLLPQAERVIGIDLYSLDGRLVSSTEESVQGSEILQIHRTGSGQLIPAGIYTVRITGMSAGVVTRRVVILN